MNQPRKDFQRLRHARPRMQRRILGIPVDAMVAQRRHTTQPFLYEFDSHPDRADHSLRYVVTRNCIADLPNLIFDFRERIVPRYEQGPITHRPQLTKLPLIGRRDESDYDRWTGRRDRLD